MTDPKVLTLAEVSKLLELHPISLYRLIKQGKLPHFRVGKVLRFDADQMEAWLLAKKLKAKPKVRRHKYKSPMSSAEYVAYGRGATFAPENLLETFAITRPLLVESWMRAKRTAKRNLVCERCRAPRKPVAALVLFASEQAKRPWKKAAMPFCRGCFSALRKLAAPETGGRDALDAASKIDRLQS